MTTLLQTQYTLIIPPILVVLFFVWGFVAARSRGRSGVVWGIACGVTFFIGIAILYSLGARPATSVTSQGNVAALDESASRQQPAAAPPLNRPVKTPPDIVLSESPDDRRWRYLCEYHPTVRDAVADVAPLGEDALYELKAAHLAIDDVSVLPTICEHLHERFGKTSGAKFASTHAGQNGKTNGAINGRTNGHLAAVEETLDEDFEEPLRLEAPMAAKENARRNAERNGARAESAKAASVALAAASPMEAAAEELTAAADEHYSGASKSSGRDSDHDDGDGNDDLLDLPSRERPSANTALVAASTVTNGARIEIKPPARTDVTPSDLVGAKFLETYAGVHLFGLVDGRVFIDRHEARGNLDLARNYIDQVATRRTQG